MDFLHEPAASFDAGLASIQQVQLPSPVPMDLNSASYRLGQWFGLQALIARNMAENV